MKEGVGLHQFIKTKFDGKNESHFNVCLLNPTENYFQLNVS